MKKGDFGHIWPKFSECSNFAENLHPAQFDVIDFKSGCHSSKFGQKVFAFNPVIHLFLGGKIDKVLKYLRLFVNANHVKSHSQQIRILRFSRRIYEM